MPSQKILKLEISDIAKDDLRDIAQYTFTHYGEQQVDIYLNALYDGMDMLTIASKVGHKRDDLPNGYKLLNIEKHRVVFTIKDDTVIVARIIHQSRDITRCF